MSRQADPYQKPSEDLNRRLGQLAQVFGKLNETGVSRLSVQERLGLEKDLKQHVNNCEWELNDADEALTTIEVNRSKFQYLSDQELHDRRAFVQRSKIYLQGIKSRMASQQSQPPKQPAVEKLVDVDLNSNTNGSSSGGAGGGGGRPLANNRAMNEYSDSSSYSAPNAQSTHSVIQEQQSLLKNQDQHLDSIAGGVSMLKDMSSRIGNELDDQDV